MSNNKFHAYDIIKKNFETRVQYYLIISECDPRGYYKYINLQTLKYYISMITDDGIVILSRKHSK